MRLGGPFAPGVPAQAVQLAGGEVWYPPAGDYIVSLGSQTILQWWDQTTNIWRNLTGPLGLIEVSSDYFSWRLINFSGIVQGARITAAGSGGVNGIGAAATGAAVSFGAAPANGVAAAAYPIVGGQINSTITITNGGSGFVVPPVLLLDPPPLGGVQATATCTISGGVINTVTVTNQGAGYLSAPNCYILPQWGTYQGIGPPVNPTLPTTIIPPGALGTVQPPWFPNVQWPLNIPLSGGAVLTVNPVLVGSGTLTGIVMTNYGQGYTSAGIPTATVTGVGAATAQAIMSMALQSIVITSAGVAYAAATHIFESSLGSLTATSQFINNDVASARPARGQAIAAVSTISSTVIEDAGYGFQSNPVLGVTATQGTPPTTVANLTPTTGGVTDVSVVQPSINL